jgi:hypothetical protein
MAAAVDQNKLAAGKRKLIKSSLYSISANGEQKQPAAII